MTVRTSRGAPAPIFAIPALVQPTGPALAGYAGLGLVIGALAAGITRATHRIEDGFERLGSRMRLHWMWWPALWAIVVGAAGLIEPRVLGVGYGNITGAIAGTIVGRALLVLVVLKFIAWAFYLGSGTSGGTLAPPFTIGGGLAAGRASAAPCRLHRRVSDVAARQPVLRRFPFPMPSR